MMSQRFEIIGFIGFFLVLIIVMFFPAPQSKAKKQMDKAISIEKIVYAEASESAQVHRNLQEELALKLETEWMLEFESIHEKMCASCRALHKRLVFCEEYQDPSVCDEASHAMDAIINEHFGEIFDICYSPDSGFPPCVPTNLYPYE